LFKLLPILRFAGQKSRLGAGEFGSTLAPFHRQHPAWQQQGDAIGDQFVEPKLPSGSCASHFKLQKRILFDEIHLFCYSCGLR
jgi:hypothetical protein